MPEETTESSPELVQPSSEALFRELSRQELQQNGVVLIRSIVPQELEIGSEDALGDVRFRFCSLPEDDEALKTRLKNIRASGTDRIDPSVISKHDSIYMTAAKKVNTDPINIMDTMGAMDFFRNVSEGLEAVQIIMEAQMEYLFMIRKQIKELRRLKAQNILLKI